MVIQETLGLKLFFCFFVGVVCSLILCTEPPVCSQVTVDISRVGFVPLYGSSDKQKILAVFSPSDPSTAVALYLLHRWWTADEILKTADPSRDGAVEV